MPHATARRILVVGGAGTFGSRLATGLLEMTEFDVILAGRTPETLTAAAARLAAGAAPGTRARITAVALDTASVTPDDLRDTGAFAVVDAAGPFQDGDHRLAHA